jgi:hypothetical protein
MKNEYGRTGNKNTFAIRCGTHFFIKQLMKHFLLMLICLAGIITAQGQTATKGKLVIEITKDKDTGKILTRCKYWELIL